MARLIDADKQLELVNRMTPIHGIGLEPVVAVETVRELIKGATTVEAISVEWMREKMQGPQMTEGNPFGFVLAEWLDEQEAHCT